MQIPKDHTRKHLLETAREAFFKKGFKAVSMREISKKSGIGLSNIYNYYSCKDDLLADILYPLLMTMNHMLEKHNYPENFSIEIFTSEEYQCNSIHEMMTLINRFREEFKLLLFFSQDSRFKNYEDEWVTRCTAIGMEYMAEMKKLYPHLKTDVSPFFMHFCCSWWLSMMKEIILHKELSESEIEQFISEFVRFGTGGWEKIMNTDKNE